MGLFVSIFVCRFPYLMREREREREKQKERETEREREKTQKSPLQIMWKNQSPSFENSSSSFHKHLYKNPYKKLLKNLYKFSEKSIKRELSPSSSFHKHFYKNLYKRKIEQKFVQKFSGILQAHS